MQLLGRTRWAWRAKGWEWECGGRRSGSCKAKVTFHPISHPWGRPRVSVLGDRARLLGLPSPNTQGRVPALPLAVGLSVALM